VRRLIFVFLVVLGVVALGVRFWANEKLASEDPPGMEVQFVEYDSFNQLNTSNSPLAQVQALVDRICEASMRQEWTTASRAVQQLEQTWMALSVPGSLDTEKSIETAIKTLAYHVWAQDSQSVLTTGKELTVLLNRLAS